MSNQLTNDLQFVFYVLLVNAVLALVYFIWHLYKKDYQKGWMMTIFILLAPVVAPIYLGLSVLFYEIYFKQRTEILNIEELSFSKEKIELIARDSLASAANKVPIEEALIVSGVHSTRRLILNVLKEDTASYVSSINQATANQDSEVSHYAATAITDIMNKFKQKEKRLKTAYEEDPTNELAAHMYWCHLGEFLQTHVLPRVEQERYFTILEEFTTHLEKEMEPLVVGEMYYILTIIAMAIGKNDRAEVWVEQALHKQASNLYSYKAGLRYYYESHEIDRYRELLEELKASNIRLDHATLELIRFYQQ